MKCEAKTLGNKTEGRFLLPKHFFTKSFEKAMRRKVRPKVSERKSAEKMQMKCRGIL